MILMLTGCWLCSYDPYGTKTSQLTFAFIGMIVLGIGNPFINLSIMSEIITGIEVEYANKGVKLNKYKLYNDLAGYFLIVTSVGDMVGPTVSAEIYENYDYIDTKNILCSISGTFTIIYILVCGCK